MAGEVSLAAEGHQQGPSFGSCFQAVSSLLMTSCCWGGVKGFSELLHVVAGVHNIYTHFFGPFTPLH